MKKSKMSANNIPLDIQMEIMKMVRHVKSLIRFRSVSKQWKSVIDSSGFMSDHSVMNQSHHLLIRYRVASEIKHVSVVDDSFPRNKYSLVPSPVNNVVLLPRNGCFCRRIISFDLTSQEFGDIALPASLERSGYFKLYKLNGSLAVTDYKLAAVPGKIVCHVWGLNGSSFTKLFTVKDYYSVIGFRKRDI
ncbi:hypothetical protein L1987_82111 [Smallanthus sonchifolius]|uniref:Uncharacterized protein n=1 Tax=Smallanthus sonchifolius TaxID=185202 RepID=A0ACB8YSR2_9ASTR|nr:hypothetical protein L1987_82111 [Smallanthus sonchifolius]